MPWLAAAAFLAGMSLAGLPPTSGFLAKELIYESSLNLTHAAVFVTTALWVVNVCMVAVAGLVLLVPFVPRFAQMPSEPGHGDTHCHAPTWRLVLPPLLLGGIGAVAGLYGKSLGKMVIERATIAVGATEFVPIKLWHGFSGPLLVSVATLLGGIAVFVLIRRTPGLRVWISLVAPWGPAAGYEATLAGLKKLALFQTRILQNGRLSVSLLVFISVFIAVVGSTLASRLAEIPSPVWMDWSAYELFIPVLIVAATTLTVRAPSRMTAVCALGAIGYAMAMLFVLYGAPDLAMTQVAIETLTVIMFVLVIYRLPKFAPLSSWSARLRDLIVATAAGTIMTAVTLAATFAHVPSRLTPFFAANSLDAAKGRNIVNVILVDFRGLDTLGEITVLSVAAIGIFALMRIRKPRRAPS
jgi:multicomponent Na+:H+ antiporter subunit A